MFGGAAGYNGAAAPLFLAGATAAAIAGVCRRVLLGLVAVAAFVLWLGVLAGAAAFVFFAHSILVFVVCLCLGKAVAWAAGLAGVKGEARVGLV